MDIPCPICQEDISFDDIFSTPCGHLFHHNCLRIWINRSETCPKCRKPMTKNSIHRIYITKEDFLCQKMNVLTNRISYLQTEMGDLRFKMNFSFVENSEISKVYLNYKQQMERLQKLQTSNRFQYNFTSVKNKCIISRCYKTYMELQTKKTGTKRDFIGYAIKYLEVLFKLDEAKKAAANACT